jgi:hypothetical protein
VCMMQRSGRSRGFGRVAPAPSAPPRLPAAAQAAGRCRPPQGCLAVATNHRRPCRVPEGRAAAAPGGCPEANRRPRLGWPRVRHCWPGHQMHSGLRGRRAGWQPGAPPRCCRGGVGRACRARAPWTARKLPAHRPAATSSPAPSLAPPPPPPPQAAGAWTVAGPLRTAGQAEQRPCLAGWDPTEGRPHRLRLGQPKAAPVLLRASSSAAASRRPSRGCQRVVGLLPRSALPGRGRRAGPPGRAAQQGWTTGVPGRRLPPAPAAPAACQPAVPPRCPPPPPATHAAA